MLCAGGVGHNCCANDGAVGHEGGVGLKLCAFGGSSRGFGLERGGSRWLVGDSEGVGGFAEFVKFILMGVTYSQ